MAKRIAKKSPAEIAFATGQRWIETDGAAVDATDKEVVDYARNMYSDRELQVAFMAGVNSMLLEGNKVAF